VGIDYQYNKDTPVAKTVWLDLTNPDDQQRFWDVVEEGELVYVHFAPPCGTASRAREVRTHGKVDPQPLRSDAFPDGLPDLNTNPKAWKAARNVKNANLLYAFVAEAVVRLAALNISWSIENPTNSLFWKTSFLERLFNLERAGELSFKRITPHVYAWWPTS